MEKEKGLYALFQKLDNSTVIVQLSFLIRSELMKYFIDLQFQPLD